MLLISYVEPFFPSPHPTLFPFDPLFRPPVRSGCIQHSKLLGLVHIRSLAGRDKALENPSKNRVTESPKTLGFFDGIVRVRNL